MPTKKVALHIMLCAFTLTTGCGRGVSLPSPENQDKSGANKNQLIIKRKLTDIANSKSIVSIESKNKVKSIKPLGVEIVQVPEGITVKEYMKQLSNDPTIDYVEPNYIRKVAMLEENYVADQKKELKQYIDDNISKSFNPLKIFKSNLNDPDLKLQYGIKNINAENAWSVTRGDESIIVAVVDTGVDLNHPDLEANLVKGYTTVKGTTSANDDNGHGTHVSGVIGAIANNGIGVAGLSSKCKIMPIKVLSAKGDGNDSDIAEGIVWAIDHGAKVINLSLGGGGAGRTLENAILYAYNSNAIVIAAMGNNGANVKNYPAAYKNVVAVGASDAKNKIAPFSNYGEWISVTAPGLKIHSTLPTYKVELSRYNLTPNYGILSGTSMAVPYVSALAGLILSKNKNLSRSEVRKRIEQNTNDIDKKGFDDSSGFGLIDASKSLSK